MKTIRDLNTPPNVDGRVEAIIVGAKLVDISRLRSS